MASRWGAAGERGKGHRPVPISAPLPRGVATGGNAGGYAYAREAVGTNHPSAQSYEQVFAAASHFMWAFSHSAFVLGGAAKVGVMKLTATPSATSTVRSFFMEASPRRVELPSR